MMVNPIGNSIDQDAALEDLQFLEGVLPHVKALFERADKCTHVPFGDCPIQDSLEWIEGTIEDLKNELRTYEEMIS